MADSKVTPPVILILVGGGLVLIGSFLDFVSSGSFGVSAWDGDFVPFPVTIIPVLCGVAMAVHIGLTTFASVNLPDKVLGLGWIQIHLALAFQAVALMVTFLIVEKGGADIGIGLWLMLIASILLIVGAVMRERESAPAA